MADSGKYARPATIDDLKSVLRALNDGAVDYLLIGGYALLAHGYLRATTDIDFLVRANAEQGERIKRALLVMPERVSAEIDVAWFEEGETIRVADAFVVDLLFNACGETYESLLPYREVIDFDGIPVCTVSLEGLLRTKQTVRDKDRLDRMVLERALQAKRDGS